LYASYRVAEPFLFLCTALVFSRYISAIVSPPTKLWSFWAYPG
jgi:hypothetical protein